MKLRWTFVLFAINALLLWGVLEHLAVPASERAFAAQAKSFLPLGRGEWSGLAVKRADGSFWSAQKDRWGRWWLKAPYEWPAKTLPISQINGLLSSLEVESAFAVSELLRVGQNLRSYGLETPRSILEVSNASRRLSYKIGNPTPLGGKLYILSPDEKEVWVVDAKLEECLAYTPAQLREAGMFPFSVVELEALEVEQGSKKIRYERKTGENRWQLKLASGMLPLDEGRWDIYLSQMNSAEPLEVSQEALKQVFCRFGFQMLYGRRNLIVGEKTADGRGYLAAWEGSQSVFGLPSEFVSALNPENFLVSRPLPFNVNEILSLDWTVGEKTLALRRLESGQWVIASADNTPADSKEVENLLERLCAPEGKIQFFQSSELPTLSEKLRLQTSGCNVEFLVWRDSDSVKLFHPSSEVSYQLPALPAAPPAASLADRRLFIPPLPEPESVIFRVLGAPPAENVYAGASPQQQALWALLKAQPRAKHWVEPPLANPTHQLELKVDKQTFVMDFWRQGPTWIGRFSGRAFELDEDFGALLDTFLSL